LFLSYAQSRWKFGKLDFCEPSRFIDEIDEQYIDIPRKSPSISNTFRGGIRIKAQTIRNKTARSSGSVYKSISTSDKNKSADSLDENTNVSNPDDIIEGIKVKHKRFGEGIVSKVDGQGPNKKASVVFIDGEKQLILRFARLQIVI
jgi:DNA helicase-2/ATP-dependent DNA helicase PcrA